ncbi:peroxiredoxin-like family protein [Kordiimonas sp. SCSIO 12610]|uniref:peroxiredoxin-like family protein n=1 Tax=Kordiimonas sp. SCSIO 12610 TaxID=2829597 RepID=UPI00210EE48B|nr:peroxiredoxin-like family protein [Kordiimonas sp. SCSIO 12610]UTW55947.1 AhpC/TSA family protein [Kordiimonas sp. SCSIO 12610]
MTLTETLAEAVKSSASRIPAEIREIMLNANQEIIESGIVETALKTGDKAPDFALKGANGGQVTLSEKLKEGPIVVLFYRGGWCPYCNMELKAYQDNLETLKSLGASLIAITPEAPDNSLSTKEKNELSFDVLSDENLGVSDAFGLTFTLPEALANVYGNFGINLPEVNGEDAWRLPIPAAYVINQDGEIILSHVDVNYTARLDPLDVIAALKAL